MTNGTEKIVARPFLRWAGSKRKLLPAISSLIPSSFDRYVEPFAGSACLFFHLHPSDALLGDLNEELINTYLQVKARPASVITSLGKMPDRTSEGFYRIRAQSPQSLGRVARAARFIYLNRLCFNGLYRTNMKGEFNVPFGGNRTGDMPNINEIRAAARAFKKTSFFAGPFEKVLARVKQGDFVYLDPPYSISNRRVFNNYSNDVFGINNLQRLRKELQRLDKIGIHFLLSYGLSKEGIELAKGFRTHHAVVQRQISGFSAHRRVARELLVTNY
jgi:DNA adenine methylase